MAGDHEIQLFADSAATARRAADAAIADVAMAAAADGFASWTASPLEQRAAALERAGDRLESDRGRLLALLQNAAGKALDDAVDELREPIA